MLPHHLAGVCVGQGIKGGKIAVEGSTLNGGGNRLQFCRISKNVSLCAHIVRVPPKSLEEAQASESPKA